MHRRDFLSLTASTGAALTLGAVAPSFAQAAGAADKGGAVRTKAIPIPDEPAQLNLCLQWWGIPADGINGKLDFLEANGYTAVELPTGGDLLKLVEPLRDALQGRKLTVATACGPSDFSHSEPERREEEVKKFLPQLEALGELKSVGLILCPARREIPMGFLELREDFINNTGKRLAEHAKKNGTAIVLEPLRRNETPFLRQVAEGALIARDINNITGGGAAVMGDFWHMASEETSQMGALLSGGVLLTHVHIASLGNRKVPGSEPQVDNYVDGFRGLKILGYRGAVSFEGGWAGPNKNPPADEKKKQLASMARYLREQWDAA